jgi:hypothetical protein
MAMEEIVARMGLNTSSFSRSLAGAQASVQQFSRVMGTIGIGLSAGAVLGFFKRTADEVDRTSKLAKRLAVDFEDLQGLQLGAGLSGVPVKELEKSLQELTKRAGEAQAKGGEMAKAFARYGIGLQDANGATKDTSALLREVANRIQATGSAADRAAIANAFFGETGQKMVVMLADGEAGLAAFNARLRETGGMVSAEAAKNIERMNDRLAVLEKNATAAGAAALGFGVSVGDAMAFAAKTSDDLLKRIGKIVPAARLARWSVSGLVIRGVARLGGVNEEAAAIGAARRNEEGADATMRDLDAEKKATEAIARVWEQIGDQREKNAMAALEVEQKIAALQQEIAGRESVETEPGMFDAAGEAENLLALEKARGELAALQRTKAEAERRDAEAHAKRLQGIEAARLEFERSKLSLSDQVRAIESEIAALRDSTPTTDDARADAADRLLALEIKLQGIQSGVETRHKRIAEDRLAFDREQKQLAEQIRDVEHEILAARRAQSDPALSIDNRLDAAETVLRLERDRMALLQKQTEERRKMQERLGTTVADLAQSGSGESRRGEARTIQRREAEAQRLAGRAAREMQRLESDTGISDRERERRTLAAQETQRRAEALDAEAGTRRDRLAGLKPSDRRTAEDDMVIREKLKSFFTREAEQGIKVQDISRG